MYEPHLFPLLLVRAKHLATIAVADQEYPAIVVCEHSVLVYRVLNLCAVFVLKATMSELCGPETLILLAYRRRNPDEWQVRP